MASPHSDLRQMRSHARVLVGGSQWLEFLSPPRLCSVIEPSSLKIVEQPLLSHQLIVLSLLLEISVFDHVDNITVLDCADAVRDAEGRFTLHNSVKAQLDNLLVFCVERAGRFVQQEDLRIFDDGPGNGHSLLLAAADLLPLYSDSHLESGPAILGLGHVVLRVAV